MASTRTKFVITVIASMPLPLAIFGKLQIEHFLKSVFCFSVPPMTDYKMSAQLSLEETALQLAGIAGYRVDSITPLQTLWAGYGKICRLKTTSGLSSSTQSLILKHVTPPHAKSSETSPDEGHLRKVLSYQVEQSFYRDLASRLPSEIGVAKYLGAHSSSKKGTSDFDSFSLLISDLRGDFPIAGEKRAELDCVQVHSAVAWLAGFHGFWWHSSQAERLTEFIQVEPPLIQWKKYGSTDLKHPSVWENGGYTYLATRRAEYESLCAEDSEWTKVLCQPDSKGLSLADRVATIIQKPGQYHTLIHGDVKSENLFTTTDGKSVAFFDFQYIGRGLGVCDLAKLFTCSVPLSMLVGNISRIPLSLDMQQGEKDILEAYLGEVVKRSDKDYDWETFKNHWEVALVDWLRFQASWGFWGNTRWLEARVRAITSDGQWNERINSMTVHQEHETLT